VKRSMRSIGAKNAHVRELQCGGAELLLNWFFTLQLGGSPRAGTLHGVHRHSNFLILYFLMRRQLTFSRRARWSRCSES